MARSARKLDNPAIQEQFDRASFDHARSGFQYRVSVRSQQYLLEFHKADGSVSGEKVLAYAVGSGTRAFSYLISEGGFLFEAPAAYYAIGKSWGLAPGYEQYAYPFLGRPIAPGCLSCHASFLQVEPLTLNRYRDPPFLEGGVACERCHGKGGKHVEKMLAGDLAGGTEILNPRKLPAANRDSICAQCHLNGDVRVMRPGADWRSFEPGGRLSDSQTVFVRAQKSDAMTVTGHVENLALSACKRKSGDRLWCGSCHDPHMVPAPAEASAWFRSRCTTCHSTSACTETQSARAKAKDDCIGCHMPKSRAKDAEHVVLTDHSIPRRRGRETISATASTADLVPFGGSPATSRDLALAYAIAAIGKSGGSDRERAVGLLEKTTREFPEDTEALMSLAEIYRNDGKYDMARALYERAIALDPGQVTASVGLGGIRFERGEFTEAIRLWKDALAKNVGLELVRLNLSVALLKTGDRAAAESTLKEALAINPAFAPARELLAQLSGARHP
jgi:Flp pilus assembly protein TadD